MSETAASIVVDWGTTSFRASLVTAAGGVLGGIETAQGISTLPREAFEGVLMAALTPWFAAHGPLPVVALGMVTSRNGWVEVPYVACPAGPAELAAGAVRHRLPNGADLVFLPGLTDRARRPFPDVMRGEETQVAGFGLDRDIAVVLPGTHSKWARVQGGRIRGFQTFVTGEVFGLLMTHSFIARGATQPPVSDPAAFRRGLDVAAQSAALLSLLFSARSGGLAGEISPDQLRSYVSGLVIGSELRQARDEGWFRPGDPLGIVGNDALSSLYGTAAAAFGLTVAAAPGTESIRGALTVLRHAL